MPIHLTRLQIDTAIPRVKEGLEKYLWLQRNRDAVDVSVNADYQRRFKHFYRVRRDSTWQSHFFALLEAKKRCGVTFREMLEALHQATNRCEASFASKLVATIDPTKPVIDSVVLRNLGLRLPPAGAANRLELIEELYNELGTRFSEYLKTSDGNYLVGKFRKTYPSANITEVKILDLVLWQTRTKPEPSQTTRKRAGAWGKH